MFCEPGVEGVPVVDDGGEEVDGARARRRASSTPFLPNGLHLIVRTPTSVGPVVCG